MYFKTLLYSFMIEIIVTKTQLKYINIRMLKSTCVDECHNYQFAICFPGSCSQSLHLQTMIDVAHCFSNLNKNFEEIAKVKESELINNVTFAPIYKPISGLDTMVLMVYNTDVDPSTTKFIFCEKIGSRNCTKNEINVTFVDYFTPDSSMSFEILIEAVCEKEDCYGQMSDNCGTTTELLPTTDISTSTGKATHLSIATTHSTGHTRDTTNFTSIQITNIAESTKHENTKSDVTSTSATTTRLLPTTNSSPSRKTTTRLLTPTTYFTGLSGASTNRQSLTKQSEKFTESTTHSSTTTYVISTTHLSTSTKILSTKTTNNATTPAVSKNSTSQVFNKSSTRRSSTTLTKPTTLNKYLDSTIPSSRTVTGPATVTYSSTNKASSNPVIVNEEAKTSKNIRAWVITTTAVGIVEIIIILLIVYIRWLKIQKRTASSSKEFISPL